MKCDPNDTARGRGCVGACVRRVAFAGCAWLAASSFVCAQPCEQVEWTNVSGLTARFDHAMAYDPVRRQVVLTGGRRYFFGGEGDTWTWVRAAPQPPRIVRQPVDMYICRRGATAFTVAVQSGTPARYQWRRDFMEIPGAIGLSLTIADPTIDHAGRYDAVISNECGTVTSDGAVLTVCLGDFDCSGEITSTDFFQFLAAFFNNEPAADFDGSGEVDSVDFFGYIGAFFMSC
jgi:hypothetical protein